MGNWVTTLIETQLKDNEEGLKKKKRHVVATTFKVHIEKEMLEKTRETRRK